eukprot:SAG22_NODE_157_length_16986_cov_17.230177_14_plen_187_part_00
MAAYGNQVEAAGCNGSSPISLPNHKDAPYVVEACTQRPCDVALSSLCAPPTCQNAPQPWGQWCDAGQQAQCVQCAHGEHAAELLAAGCGRVDKDEYCATDLPTPPPYLCPSSPGSIIPRKLPPSANKNKKIRWFSNGNVNNGCLMGKWNDITDGIIQCCNGEGLNESGMFPPFFGSPPFAGDSRPT